MGKIIAHLEKYWENLAAALTLNVVCNFQGDVGVVERLGEPADIDVSALGAIATVALLVAVALYVALGVARLSAFSLLTLWTLRTWRPDNGTSNAVAWKKKKEFEVERGAAGLLCVHILNTTFWPVSIN